MIVLSCNNISLSFGTELILKDITFNINQNERVGVVGANGAGKSTLFKIISGITKPDTGDIFISKGFKIGLLQQNAGLASENTIWDEMISAYDHLISMEKRIKELEKLISTEKDEQLLSSYMKQYSTLSDKFAASGGFEYNSRTRGILKGLGFDESDFARKIETLSGGQKTRLALAKLLLEEPDILLLDEPTNHLDISSTEWLEDFLKNYRKTFLVISHDRYFLDTVTNKILEIENNQCTAYKGNYSQYVSKKAENRKIQQKHYELQQKEIARLEAFIEQQKRWNRERNIIAAESRRKAIERMEKIDKPKNLPGKIRINFKSSITSGNDVLFVKNLSKEYPGKQLFKDISFDIKRNEKVFLLGPNGCGKSTLLKILSGYIEKTSGDFEYGHNVIIGYYDQEQENLDESKTIIEELLDSDIDATVTEIRNALASFLFYGEDVFKNISVLSGGEKSRICLLKLLFSGANLLILDEPTNHLDINSREALEESLLNFEGTILAVSHDRYFINKIATRILEFNGNSLNDYKGSYSDYVKYKSNLRKNTVENKVKEESAAKREHILSKKERSEQRKIEKQLAITEQEINAIENRLREIDENMLDESISSDHEQLMKLHEEKSQLESRLNSLY